MIKYIISHPIQYQVPLIRFLSKKFEIEVAYRSNISLKPYYDKEFNKSVIIQKNLLKGYKYSFLKYIGSNKVTTFFPITIEFKTIFTNHSKIIWLHGIKNWYNLFIIIISKFKNRKVFVRDEINDLKKRSFLNQFLNKFFFFIIDKFIDCYLSIGIENKNTLIKFGVNRKKIFNVPYVVDNDFFYSKNKKKSKKLKILFTGKLVHRKGCDLLLKAIFILNKKQNFQKKTDVYIVGDGNLKKKYLKLKKELNLTNVKFCGFKNQTSIKKFYRNSNLFIMPSREENWGLAVNEAMASANSIICSNLVGCSKNLVKNNYNGYIFKSDDFRDLAKKIFLIYKNPIKLNHFSNNSLKIISKYSFDECYKGIIKAINYVKL
jgi:glycosyltransferase involved in cell wall biosynthesis